MSHSLWLGLLVACGASMGALARWAANIWFNPLWGGFPLGTFTVNVVGGFLAGAGYVVFGKHQQEAARLLLITGFLGGLTTFSTFSAESLALIERGRPGMAIAHTLAHVLGALGCAMLGAKLARWWV
ncbi:MAG: fluoride efflux transporter CrcB [Rubrivivax sp.]|nr:MAG: fluoride efflux transporter CrcB [Rubrivivax sp.]